MTGVQTCALPICKELSEKLSVPRPDIKIMFMSGYAEEGSPYTWNLREGLDFLQKPFSPSVLVQKVRAVLDTAQTVKHLNCHPSSGHNLQVDLPENGVL